MCASFAALYEAFKALEMPSTLLFTGLVLVRKLHYIARSHVVESNIVAQHVSARVKVWSHNYDGHR